MREADDMDFTPEEMSIINSEDDMEDGYFDIGEEDDIWADDYVGMDDDIEKTDLADSPDDEEFDDFDDDEEFDIEDPRYWADAKEINPDTAWEDTLDDIRGDQQTGYFDNFNDHDADEYGAYGSDRFFAARDLGRGMSAKEVHDTVDEDFSGYRGDYAEPIHHDEEFVESRKARKSRIVENYLDKLNAEPSLMARKVSVTSDMLSDATSNVGEDYDNVLNYLKAKYDPNRGSTPYSINGRKFESKRAYGKRMKEDTSAFMVSPKAADENREIPEWVIKKFGIREGRKYWANKQAKLKEAKGFTGYNSHAHGTLILTPRATEVAEIWQDALDMYDAGKLQGKNEFINYIIKERNGEEGYTDYMPYIATFTHKNGRPWGYDEFTEIENNNNGFMW